MIPAGPTGAEVADGVAAQLTGAAQVIAGRFSRGGTLWCVAFARPSHARHVAVEFVHPVIVGKRAFPAIAVDPGEVHRLPALVEAGDLVLVIADGPVVHGADGGVVHGLEDVLAAGAEVVWVGTGTAHPSAGQVVVLPPATDPLEVHEHAVRAYHVLWELVHVCLEHRPTEGAPSPPEEATAFLYPFLQASTSDQGQLAIDLAASASAKWTQSGDVSQRTLAASASVLAAAARDVADRIEEGGRILAFGNGGSATDAQALVDLCTDPPWGRALPARNLAGNSAVLTALANDVGVDVVFARQLAAHARPGDVAVGVSTSGGSANVLAALRLARRHGLTTVGLTGYGGGELATGDIVDHVLVVDSDSVHRIQEAQVALVHDLWRRVQGAWSGGAR